MSSINSHPVMALLWKTSTTRCLLVLSRSISAEFTTASTSTLITYLCRLNAEVKAVEISLSLKQMLYTQSLTSFWWGKDLQQLPLSFWASVHQNPNLLKVCGRTTRMLLTQQLEKSWTTLVCQETADISGNCTHYWSAQESNAEEWLRGISSKTGCQKR